MAEQIHEPTVREVEESEEYQYGAMLARHKVRNSGLALAAFWTAAAAWIVIPLVGAIAAIIMGILAGQQIRRANGRLKGSDLATAAIVIGGVQIGFIIFAVVGVMLAVPAG